MSQDVLETRTAPLFSRIKYGLFFLLFSYVANAQKIVGFEYFIDEDPGIGLGTFVNSNEISDSLVQEITIPEATLVSPGFHFVGVRSLDENGNWGHYIRRSFNVNDSVSTSIDTSISAIVGYEYFIDEDPGVGNGIIVNLESSSKNDTSEIVIPTPDDLLPGFHFIGIRAKDSTGKWGHYTRRSFKIDRPTSSIIDTEINKIIGYEYFIDVDPGVGNGTFISLDLPDQVNTSEIIIPETDTLSLGFHFIGVRSLDEKGNWGHYLRRSFKVDDQTVKNRVLDTNSYPMVGYEYFFDDVDPGVGNATYVDFENELLSINEQIIITSDGLSKGEHKLTFRIKDNLDRWSHNHTEIFEVCIDPLPAAMPSFVEGGTVCNGGGSITYKASGSPTGEYNWYTKSSGGTPILGNFGVEKTDSFLTRTNLISSEVVYVATKAPGCNSSRVRLEGIVVETLDAPVVSNQTRCGEGIVIFEPLSGAPEGGSYNWYNSDTSQIPFFVGEKLETSVLSESRAYSVESINAGGICTSPNRVSPIAIIKTCIDQNIIFNELPDVIFGLDEPIALKAFTVDLDGNPTNQEVFYRITEGEDRAFIRNDSLFYTGIGVVKVSVGSVTDTNYIYNNATIVVEEFKITADAAQVAILNNSPVCEGERLTLSPTLIKDGIYQWVIPSGEKVDTRLYSIFPVEEKDSGLYRLFVYTPLDTLFSSVLIEVNPEPKNLILDSVKLSGCANKSFLLEGTGIGFKTYNWYLNGGLLSSTDKSIFSPIRTGSYHLVGIDSNLCSRTTSPLFINLEPKTTPKIALNSTKDKLVSTPGIRYQWYINDLLISTGDMQELDLYLNGTYKVEVEDEQGCTFFSGLFDVDEESFYDISKYTGENINENILREEIYISPQPASKRMNISLLAFQKVESAQYNLHDSQGKIVQEGALDQISSSTYFKSLDVSQLNAGFYYLRVPRLDFIKTKKVIIE